MLHYTTIDGTPRGCASKPYTSMAAAQAVAAEQNARAEALGVAARYHVARCEDGREIGYTGNPS